MSGVVVKGRSQGPHSSVAVVQYGLGVARRARLQERLDGLNGEGDMEVVREEMRRAAGEFYREGGTYEEAEIVIDKWLKESGDE